MRNPVIAILLCVLAAMATAQTPAPQPRPASKHTTASGASARPATKLIKAAEAATQDPSEAAARPAGQHAGDGDGRSHSDGNAMLLAALAVMGGIALRRFTRNQ